MSYSTRSTLARRLAGSLVATLVLVVGLFTNALAYIDVDHNRIDDRIENVHAVGWNAAFVNNDPTRRMKIGVENPANIIFAIYVGYDHKPTTLDQTLLAGTGVSMVWPFLHINYVESRATWLQIEAIKSLPGVTRVEAIPVEYANNHYGSRVVRSRDSRGLSASENYALFPSVRGNLGLDGTGVVIAILDTGINDDVDQINPGYPGHESLHGKFLGGGEFWCGQALCSTAPNASTNPQDHGGEASSYHATHVAGSAVGTGGPDGFFAGVAPGARFVDCKVLSDAGASVGGSNRGIEWVVANKNRLWSGLSPGSIWQGIDVVSMSLGDITACEGGVGEDDGASGAYINAAVDAGLVICIATGNESATGCIAPPASSDKSLAVGASTHNRTLDRSDDKVTDFSNEGPRDDDLDSDHYDEMKPSVVAPGAGIISAFGDPTTDGTEYQQLSGTSMATPHVSGCVALLLQANPSLTPSQVRTILQNTAEHNIPTAKSAGDRGQDPYGLDPNYDPSCGWGLVDMYAACKEAMNSVSGVQVVQIRGIAHPSLGRIDFQWVTQREYPFQGFNVYRAPDASGAPGAYVQINGSLIPGVGDPVIEGDDNRTPYLYQDTDPGLTLGQTYWYKVEWLDLGSVAHAEPPVPVPYGELARVATAFYSIAHNAVDNDLAVRIGFDLDYDPGTLGSATWEVLGPGEAAQDSAVVLLNGGPANTGPATLGTIDHFWSVGFKQGDGMEMALPPHAGVAWFLSVIDGGYVNRNGRVTSFSLFVNDSPGSASGTTYVTDHSPMPQPMVEGGVVPATLWIPEQGSLVSVEVAQFQGELTRDGVRLTLTLLRDSPGTTAQVFRSRSEDFARRQLITPEPLLVENRELRYEDHDLESDATYYYWVAFREPNGNTIMNGPVAIRVPGSTTVAVTRAPYPNPVASGTSFEYAVGGVALRSGDSDIAITVHDLQGRTIRTLEHARKPAGVYRGEWNATDDRGARVPGGVYLLQIRAGSESRNVKLSVVN